MKASGLETEAKRLLEDWMTQYPQNIAARWTNARFHDDSSRAASVLEGVMKEQEGTPWNPVSRDPHFKLIVEVSKVLDI